MTREKKPVNWGQPGQTGVTKSGVPWYVPDKPPGLVERVLYKMFPGNGTSGMPAGARLVPARTPAEVRDRCLFKYRDRIVEFLAPGEEIAGFIGCSLDQHVPQPPRIGIEAKLGPNPVRHWWMGGDWETMAGRLVVALGISRSWDTGQLTVLEREMTWVRTSRRALALIGPMSAPDHVVGEYRLDQVGLRPGWARLKGEPLRVDIAFADGSWLGVLGSSEDVPGPTEGPVYRDLLVELVGPPVVGSVLPARGLG